MKRYLSGIVISISVFLFFSCLLAPSRANGARLKEISKYYGIRSNHLIGYGLVVGLDGLGDKSGTGFTTQSLANMLNRLGVRVDSNDISVKNVASVIVTAELSPLDKIGSTIDVTVSSIGDAKSLQGGTLLFTPLSGGNGEVYALAQGPVSVGGFLGGGDDAGTQKNFLTVGRVSGGALVEKDIPLRFSEDIYLVLNNPDFTTASSVAREINASIGDSVALPYDSAKVLVNIPQKYHNNFVDFLAMVERIEVPVDTVSRVVVNERTGTVVVGENVRISKVAVSHGNLTVEVDTSYNISQPTPFSGGETVVQPERSVVVNEEEARLITVEPNTRLGELVGALNALGVTPRDLISILQAIKAAGALQAELELI